MMEDVEKIAAGLTKAQREAIHPGPGNPAYSRGPLASMRSLERKGIVKDVATWSSVSGGRSARLTPLGLRVKEHLSEDHAR